MAMIPRKDKVWHPGIGVPENAKPAHILQTKAEHKTHMGKVGRYLGSREGD